MPRRNAGSHPPAIKYQGAKILIEETPWSAWMRATVAALSMMVLVVGLKGVFQLAETALGLGDGAENILVGTLFAVAFTVVPTIVLYKMLDSGRTLLLEPETKQARLTKRYPFKTVQKHFPFRSLRPCELKPVVDMENVWNGRMVLPDRTHIEFCSHDGMDYKEFAQLWQKRINAMIERPHN